MVIADKIRRWFVPILLSALLFTVVSPVRAAEGADEQTKETTKEETAAPTEAEGNLSMATEETTKETAPEAESTKATEPEEVNPEDFLQLISEAAILMDAETGQILYHKNIHKQMYPASITKIMTGMLALKNLDPDTVLRINTSALRAVPDTSSHIALHSNDEMTVEQLMYALALESANDAANVLAEGVSGTLKVFAEKMTEEAHRLGAVNTHFANANGLPDKDHYTTAYDMALITIEALNTPGLATYFSTAEYTCAPTKYYKTNRTFTNRNQMISSETRYEGVLMSKTGWTSSAWGTLVTVAKQGNTTLVAVTLKSPNTEDKYTDTWALFDYGFHCFADRKMDGVMVAEKLGLEGFAVSESTAPSYRIPADADLSQMVFAADIPDLSEFKGDKYEVEITAAYGDMELPAQKVTLVRYEPEPETQVTEAAETEPFAFLDEEQIPTVGGQVIITAAIVVISALTCFGAYMIWRKKHSG